jgi:hypothetical protein
MGRRQFADHLRTLPRLRAARPSGGRFKPQNISNNAAVAHDGGEIGGAQALQALPSANEEVGLLVCGLAAHVLGLQISVGSVM